MSVSCHKCHYNTTYTYRIRVNTCSRPGGVNQFKPFLPNIEGDCPYYMKRTWWTKVKRKMKQWNLL